MNAWAELIKLKAVLDGKSDSNINFDDLRNLLIALGFEERINSSHHIFRKDGVLEHPNLQKQGSKAKTYQVRQIRKILKEYGLEL